MNAVKIVGMGLVTGLGSSVRQVYEAACAGKDTFRELTRFDASPYAQIHGGPLSDEQENQLRQQYPDDDISIAMMKQAGTECMAQCADAVAGSRTGLVLATNFGPMETLEWAWRERFDTGTLDEDSYAQFAHVLDIIGDFFACNGPRTQLSMSCASGAAAVAVAKDMIHSGRADRVLVLAYDSLTEYCWCGLSNLRTITTDTMRPFDARRSGTLFSEGAAAMLLGAEDTPGTPLAWLSGAATNNNAFHMTAPRKEAEGSRLVMAAALKQAGLTPQDIDHVCAHGTSTHANDETEAGAFRNLLGDHLAETSVVAHKSQLGHLLGAAGLAEAILTVESMAGGVIPPTLRCEQLDPACQGVTVSSAPQVRTVRNAVTNSAGIGGNNAALVLSTEKHEGRALDDAGGTRLHVRGMSWVLPGNIGQGRTLLEHPEWISEDLGLLEGFSPKPYVSSVKGYLDPAGATMLAAFSMIAEKAADGFDPRQGIATMTRFGACKSSYAFFEQLATKGPRFASPMIFPHGYANAAGNLAAIELGFCGPHMVFFGHQDERELLEFAMERLRNGDADEMLVGVVEATVPAAIPDGWKVPNGAIALRLAWTPSADDLFSLDMTAVRNLRRPQTIGAVAGLARLLEHIA